MPSINDTNSLSSIEQFTNATIPDSTNKVLLAGAEDKEKSELRKKLKEHHKMLTDKADEHYEKGEKELGKKHREMARKLEKDMEDEKAELSLASYEVEDAAMSSSFSSQLQTLKDELTLSLSKLQEELLSIKTVQLQQNVTDTPITVSVENKAKLKDLITQVTTILGENKSC